ncbi:hypothetical protein BV898_09274 [Hypsibius exemplaris]|uniref:G-protein coupled receptors family 1 profile domain-containing protein n=1 Tax=Hypsibius exemplaris TaxID=2072580 RepID=A0A1W0WN13_HYPEX|nr:hypothetical protein BV898_09274 [Hypsibius exemplaris]
MNETNATIASNETVLTPQWAPLPVCLLLTFLTGFTGNGLLLMVFATHRALWTPFNVYVVNLLVANFCCIVTQFPFDVYSTLYGGWGLGERVCDFYISAAWFFQPVIFNSHQMIAINRIWAVSHPISYRRIHSIRTAVSLCCGVWVYVFVGLSVGVIQDRLYHRLPLDTSGCQLDPMPQFVWAVVIQVVYIIWPQIVMVVALVVIFMAKRAKNRINMAMHSTVASQGGGAQLSRRSGGDSVPHPTAGGDEHDSQQKKPNRPVQRSNGTLLLVLLTLSVTVCWTPNNVYYSWFFFDQQLNIPVFSAITIILIAFQATVDPIMFTLAFPSLRLALRQTFSFRT